ncbi:MAG: tetratricopeptide repeat protein [Parvibaculum sp.]|nr:tetratricopeptide repeat protein [Parvibaculum sp.]
MALNYVSGFFRAVLLFTMVPALAGCASLEKLGGGRASETAYGDYLAARYASSVNAPDLAEKYYDKTLSTDGNNPIVLERAFMSAAYAGDMSRAVRLARQLIKLAPDHRMARLVLALDDIRDGDYDKAQTQIGNAEGGVFAALVGTLTQAWAAAGAGERDVAIAKLDTFKGKPAFDLFRTFHTAQVLDLLGDKEGAQAAYTETMEASGGGSIRIVEAYASFQTRQGDMDGAKETVNAFLALSPRHPLAVADAATLNAGKPLKPLITSASQGVAEALYGLGSALAQESGSDMAVLYLRLAIWMRPDFDVAHTLLADTYEQKKQWADAIASYSHVSSSSPLYSNARIQTAINLDHLDREADAIDVLNKLAKNNPASIEPHVALGDIYRAKEKYADAAKQYDLAIKLAGPTQPSHWSLYYARGICMERMDKWADAERDLKLALKLSDDHPLVLNYLGYSWIEQGTHLTEALAMIEKAVELRPTDGFIVDSLGWARYRLGDYEHAVQVLQRAVELEPGDSTINDHLGDAFWKVGRKIEARFQWSHALEMKPGEDRVPVLKAKLQFGLEAAEAAELKKPLSETGS